MGLDTTQLVTRHVLLSPVENTLRRTVGDPDAQCRKTCCQVTFFTMPTTDFFPACGSQHRLCGNRQDVGDRMLARTAMTSDGKDQSDIIGIDLLMLGDADHPGEVAATHSLGATDRP